MLRWTRSQWQACMIDRVELEAKLAAEITEVVGWSNGKPEFDRPLTDAEWERAAQLALGWPAKTERARSRARGVSPVVPQPSFPPPEETESPLSEVQPAKPKKTRKRK